MTTMSETQTVSEQTEHTQGGMELLMQDAPTIGERIAALEADRDRLLAEVAEYRAGPQQILSYTSGETDTDPGIISIARALLEARK